MTVTYEPVFPEHADELARIRVAAMRESLERIGRFDPDRAAERILNSFKPDYTRFINHYGTRVGFIVVIPQTDGLKLDHLYIEPGFQNMGIGNTAMLDLLNVADAQGLAIHVTALRGSDSNRFYKRHDFVRDSESEWDVHYVRKPRLT